MLILAFDTTSEAGGVGIFRDEECLAQVTNDGPANRYSVTLFSMADQAIAEAKARQGVPKRGLADIGLIAAATGPGSFTGIRIGLAAAQGWAMAFDLPVCGVSALEALAATAHVGVEWAVAILDARRGEFYVGLFHRDLGPRSASVCPGRVQGLPPQEGQPSFVPADEGWVLRPAELAAFLTRRLPAGVKATCVVREHDQAALGLREVLSGPFQWQVVAGTLVEPVAHLGLQNYLAGKPQAAGGLDAYYIRRPDAEVNRTE